jgi:serine/threonine-protein kinase
MGEVWRAEHHLLARSAAIKLIRKEALANPKANQHELRERFRREAQTLASMQSRHTTTIYDYGVAEDGTFYYVMELLDGLDFESLVTRHGPLPPARVIHLAMQACSSLAEAHAAGLFHRDIKPPNLFTCRAADEVDVVKLLDFGIVHSADEPTTSIPITPVSGASDKLTQLGSMLGTPGFMAKEQILGLPIDGRADLYALACVMWWMLTGAEVYRRTGKDSELFDQHLFEPVPSLRSRMRGWCPVELEVVMSRCLAKEPSDRPADAKAFAAELRAIPIPAEHAWTDDQARSWWADYRPPAPVPSIAVSQAQRLLPQETPLGD